MKKICAVICALLSIIILASCSSVTELKITDNGKVISKIKVYMTEDEFVKFQSSQNDFNDDYDYYDFYGACPKEVVNGKEYYVYETDDTDTIQNTNNYLNYEESFFSCIKVTKNDVCGRFSDKLDFSKISSVFKNMQCDDNKIVFTFPREIVKTNGTLSSNKKSVSIKIKAASNFYAATSDSTASWAKASDSNTAVNTLVNNRINKFKVSYKFTSKNSVKFTWSKNNATKFNIYKMEYNDDDYYYSDYKLIKTTSQTKFELKNLKKDTKYYIYISASNNDWIKETKNYYLSILTGKSKIKSASVQNKKLTMKFNKYDMANGYYVYRSSKKNGSYKKVATVKTNSYIKSGLKKGTYYYKVKAYQNAGKDKNYTKLSDAKKVVVK